MTDDGGLTINLASRDTLFKIAIQIDTIGREGGKEGGRARDSEEPAITSRAESEILLFCLPPPPPIFSPRLLVLLASGGDRILIPISCTNQFIPIKVILMSRIKPACIIYVGPDCATRTDIQAGIARARAHRGE